MQMTLGRWGIALALSLAVHLTGVTTWSGFAPDQRAERTAGALAQVATVLSPSQFYPSIAVEETEVEEVKDVNPTHAEAVSEPLPSATAPQVDQTAQPNPLKPIADTPSRSTQASTSPSASTPNVASVQTLAVTAPVMVPKAPRIDQGSSIGAASTATSATRESQEAVSQSAEPAQAKPLKQPDEQKLAAIAKTTPVEQVVETETLRPNKPKERAKRAKKRPAKKKPRKVKKKKGKTSKKARRANAASSARKGTARRNVGDGGRSNKSVGRAKLSSYLGRVASKVKRQKRYPKSALIKNRGGTAVVAFTITKRGTVTGVRLKRGSGNAAIDREVLNMVRRAAPFPPIPKGTGRSRIPLSIPVRFAVR